MKHYKIKKLCFDANLNAPPYENNPTEEFGSYEEAWAFIERLADEEVEELNKDCVKDVSFGIVEDDAYDRKEMCEVQCYCLEDEYDDTGHTETVTQYSIQSV